MEENQTSPKKTFTSHEILNYCVVIFVGLLSIVSLVTFFVAIVNNPGIANMIVSVYILAMLLGVPTLKVFLDKCTTDFMKRVNIVGVVHAFVTIFIMTFAIVIAMVV